jgi:ketosteroid isomerase-like protein
MGYIRRLWEAFERGGVSAMADLIPPDVTWRPLEAGGQALRGTEDLDKFWSSREVVVPTIRMFYGHGDDVLVEAEYPRHDGSHRTVWMLYRFDGERLVEAVAFQNEAEARSWSRPASG